MAGHRLILPLLALVVLCLSAAFFFIFSEGEQPPTGAFTEAFEEQKHTLPGTDRRASSHTPHDQPSTRPMTTSRGAAHTPLADQPPHEPEGSSDEPNRDTHTPDPATEPSTLEQPSDTSASQPVTIRPPRTSSLMIAANAGVWGQVTSMDAAPLMAAHVYLLARREGSLIEVARASTEEDGFYGIGDTGVLAQATTLPKQGTGYTPRPLQPGAYRLEVRARDMLLAASDIELSASLLRHDVTLVSVEKRTIRIRIENSDGREPRAPMIQVIARDSGIGGETHSRFERMDPKSDPKARIGEQSFSRAATAVVDAPGTFSLEVPLLPKLELTVRQSGYVAIAPTDGTFEIDTALGLADVYTVRFDRYTRGDTASLDTATIKGRVALDVPSANLSSTRIRTEKPDGTSIGARVGPDGSFEISGLASNQRYRLVVTHREMRGAYTHDVDLFGALATVFMDIRPIGIELHFENRISDLVTASLRIGNDTQPIIKEQALANGQDGAVMTDTGWAPGEYFAEVVTANGSLEGADALGRVRFTIPADVAAFKRNFVVLSAAGLDFQLIDAKGVGWAGAELRLLRREAFEQAVEEQKAGNPIDWTASPLIRADNLGQGILPNLAPGDYTLLIWTRSRDPQQWNMNFNFAVGPSSNVSLVPIVVE